MKTFLAVVGFFTLFLLLAFLYGFLIFAFGGEDSDD